jgi:hypothetical protein
MNDEDEVIDEKNENDEKNDEKKPESVLSIKMKHRHNIKLANEISKKITEDFNKKQIEISQKIQKYNKYTNDEEMKLINNEIKKKKKKEKKKNKKNNDEKESKESEEILEKYKDFLNDVMKNCSVIQSVMKQIESIKK